jgi:hypothetical protein
MSPLDADALLPLLQQHYQCLHELHALGQKQQTLIARHQISELLLVLHEKERRLLALQQIERAMAPFQEQTAEQRVWRSNQAKTRCRQLRQQCQELLMQIVRQEEESAAQLQHLRDAAAVQLAAAQSGRQVLEGYAASTRLIGTQLDLTSETVSPASGKECPT